ncbi:MAG: hypothetical protein FWE21_02895 [Defluviitaleaceae bacterium]|nr:hypothetical protein [Defluviitaleaceae bacterium]
MMGEKYNKRKLRNICLLGGYHQIVAYLAGVEGGSGLLAKYRAVFEGDKCLINAKEPEVAAFLRIYEDYLKWALTHQTTTDRCKAFLLEKLQTIFAHVKDWDELQTAIVVFLEGKGYHANFGVTAPYPTLYLWKRQKVKKMSVRLPHGIAEIDVCAMKGVVTRGWLGYLSFDKISAGGWVTATGCNYFTDKYNMLSSDFKVSLLKHEAQHFYDLEQFPEMESADLEYRAKLVELIYHKKIQRFFGLIGGMGDEDGGDRKTNPHGHANRKIVEAMSTRSFGRPLETDQELWKAVKKKIPAMAQKLLDEDNKRLRGEV